MLLVEQIFHWVAHAVLGPR